MAWLDTLHSVNLPYNRTFTEKYGYETEKGKQNARYIFTWFMTRTTGVQYAPLCGMMGCFNGESRLNPAAVFGFNSLQYLLNNRFKAFGICQFVPGCLPTSKTPEYWRKYHGTNKPIYYYWLADNQGGSLNTLYTEPNGVCSDMRAQLEYIYKENGWKRTTETKYAVLTNKVYRGSINDFLQSTRYSVREYAEWFYAAFVRSGGAARALPVYANFAERIYKAFYDEFGDGSDPPTPGPEPGPDPEPEPEPVPERKLSNFIVVAKAAKLF